MLTYSLSDTGTDSLYVYLYKCIKNDILRGILTAGTKLPSKRSFAKNLGISNGKYFQFIPRLPSPI